MILLIMIHIFNDFLSLFQSSSYINYHLTVILKPHITPPLLISLFVSFLFSLQLFTFLSYSSLYCIFLFLILLISLSSSSLLFTPRTPGHERDVKGSAGLCLETLNMLNYLTSDEVLYQQKSHLEH